MYTPTPLALAFSRAEGYGVPGAIPTTHNNPGDLRHAPKEQHAPGDPDGVGYFDNANDGWAALDRQLQLYADRGMTIAQAVETFAPSTENNTDEYIEYVCTRMGCTEDTLVSQVI